MTGSAAFDLYRSMFVNEWPLLVRMTPNARSIRSDGKFRLFRFKSSVRVVTVTAPHRPFEHFVMERFCELRFCFGMA
jgi:hypothetical protein